ncbi:hypothetical protein D3C81_2290560 [compost metagenome]
MQVRQRHQHVGMPAAQKTLKVFALPGERAEHQAYQLSLVDAVGFAELYLLHIALVVATRLVSQP